METCVENCVEPYVKVCGKVSGTLFFVRYCKIKLNILHFTFHTVVRVVIILTFLHFPKKIHNIAHNIVHIIFTAFSQYYSQYVLQ